PLLPSGLPGQQSDPRLEQSGLPDQWRAASETLQFTNNFPGFTRRLCPAACEASCTLNIIDNPVTIKTIECQIVDRAWEEGWIQPVMAPKKTGKTVGVG